MINLRELTICVVVGTIAQGLLILIADVPSLGWTWRNFAFSFVVQGLIFFGKHL
jgi:hypothetical protein